MDTPTICPDVAAQRARNAAHQRHRRRQIAYGRWEPFTDPTPVIQHIDRLRAKGMSMDTITDLAGLRREALNRIYYPATKDHPERVRPYIAEAVLAVRFDLDRMPDTHWIDATGTARRLQGLARMGWSWTHIGARLDVTPTMVSKLAWRRSRVSVWNARRVRDLYDELAMTPGDSPRSITWAVKRGWVPPLAWDDDTIDDPRAQPHEATAPVDPIVDEIAVARAVAGDLVSLTSPERAEAVRRLHPSGMNDTQMAARIGARPETVMRIRHRLGLTANVDSGRNRVAA